VRRRRLEGTAIGLQFSDAATELRHEIGRRFDRREIAYNQQSATNSQVVSGAPNTGLHVPMHHFHVHRWKYVIDKADVILSKCSTIHQGDLIA
jgi:hypothetical protein